MRQTSGSTSLWSPVCLTGVPHQRLSTPQRIGISRSRPRCSPVASPPRPHGGLVYSREGQVKRFGSLGRQAEESQSSADLQAFTDWLSESGCQGITGDTHKVEIYQYGEDGRGLRATKDIKAGELILTVPQDLVLAHRSDEEAFNAELEENLDDFTAIAVKLLRERAQLQHSRYYPYIQVLPRSVPSLLGGFPESLREELQGFVSDPDWEEGRNKPAFEYAKVAQSLLMSGFEEDDFRWAYSVVNSRAFAELIPKKMMYLAPLLDMMDHGGWRQMLGYKPEDRPDILDIDNVWWSIKNVGGGTWEVQATAIQDISMGQPLLMRYVDCQPGTHYLKQYGFVPILDPFSEVDLFSDLYGNVSWTVDRLFPESDGMGEGERQQLTAEAHRAARELVLKELMAGFKNAGVSQDFLEKSQPLAVKIRRHQTDKRFVIVTDVLKQHWQASAREKGRLYHQLLLERTGEVGLSAHLFA